MNDHGSHANEVPITIDRRPYKVAESVTGQYLYQLGGISAEYELYVEARGQGDDELIENTEKSYPMHPGEKLYSAPKSLNPGV